MTTNKRKSDGNEEEKAPKSPHNASVKHVKASDKSSTPKKENNKVTANNILLNLETNTTARFRSRQD